MEITALLYQAVRQGFQDLCKMARTPSISASQRSSLISMSSPKTVLLVHHLGKEGYLDLSNIKTLQWAAPSLKNRNQFK